MNKEVILTIKKRNFVKIFLYSYVFIFILLTKYDFNLVSTYIKHNCIFAVSKIIYRKNEKNENCSNYRTKI